MPERHSPLVPSEPEPWDIRGYFLNDVKRRGGFANHHAHFDKAYLITSKNPKLGHSDLTKKWDLYRVLKERYTHDDLVKRISLGIETMIGQGVSYCRTMVDADSFVGLRAIRAAKEAQSRYIGQIKLEIGIQPLEGVLNPASFEYYQEACRHADYCGGHPSRDHPREEEHIDIILDLAKRLRKPIDVHVDQENSPFECQTEMLALKTIEHQMQGRVFGVHAVSLAAKDEKEQDRIIESTLDADLGIIICPSAALSMKQLPLVGPLHNSIAPYPKLREAGVRCYLGTDNIHDLFMPIADGDMWVECRMLMEACRFYDLDAIAELACAQPIRLEPANRGDYLEGAV